MTNGQQILKILGVATRARKTVTGYDAVILNIQRKIVKMVFISSDASDNTKDKFLKKCFFYQIPIDLSFSSIELSNSIGRENVKIIGINDQGFIDSLSKLLKEGVNNESK